MRQTVVAAPRPTTYQKICRIQIWLYHGAELADSVTIVALYTKAVPNSINAQIAAICSLSMRDRLSLKNPSNISARLGHPFYAIGPTAFAVEQRLVDFVSNRSASFPATSCIDFDLDHNHDSVSRIVVRCEGCKPRGVRDRVVVSVHHLGGSCFSSGRHTGHFGICSSAIENVLPHRCAEDFKAAPLDAEMITDTALGKDSGLCC